MAGTKDLFKTATNTEVPNELPDCGALKPLTDAQRKRIAQSGGIVGAVADEDTFWPAHEPDPN